MSLVPVVLGRDFGNTVEVLSGLSGQELVIDIPPDSLVEGETVRIVQSRTKNVANESSAR